MSAIDAIALGGRGGGWTGGMVAGRGWGWGCEGAQRRRIRSCLGFKKGLIGVELSSSSPLAMGAGRPFARSSGKGDERRMVSVLSTDGALEFRVGSRRKMSSGDRKMRRGGSGAEEKEQQRFVSNGVCAQNSQHGRPQGSSMSSSSFSRQYGGAGQDICTAGSAPMEESTRDPSSEHRDGERGQESASRSGRRAFSSMGLLGLIIAFTLAGKVGEVSAAEETQGKPKPKKGRAPSSPYDEDRLLEQNRRMQRLNNAPSEFPGFVREGFQVKVIINDKYITSRSGLIYYDMVVGQGDLPLDGQQVIFHYTGYNESGRRVDSSYQQGRPARTRLGIKGMIPGFEEGIKSMKPGGRRIIIVPPELGPPVGPSTFFSAKQFEVFDVELLEAKDCSRRTLLFYSDVVCD